MSTHLQRSLYAVPAPAARLLPSAAVDRIKEVGAKAWEIEYPQTSRFVGSITNPSETKGGPSVCKVETNTKCQDICLMSNLPLMAGMYDGRGKKGFYYEILIQRMDGLIAIGELPGWNRLSAALHLDDLRKFFEDPDGGRDYTEALTQVSSGDTVGCGYEFTTGALFFTYNGQRLVNAFTGIYLPRHNHDVFAAIGAEGRNDFEVNFGAELFRWKEGNEWAWLTEGSVGGQMSGGPSDAGDELPSYNDTNSSTAFTY
ncbi:endosome protein [Salix suchowensis]|nr:endosome protein [Salix suchowensis]